MGVLRAWNALKLFTDKMLMKKFEVTGYNSVRQNEDEHYFTFEGPETMQVSDGYHTMDEVYDHRIALFMQVCKMQAYFNEIASAQGIDRARRIWKSKNHHPTDKPMFEGWFIMGIDTEPGRQITYHLPLKLWDECDFAIQFIKAPKWDGHTSADVLERLKRL